MIAKDAEGFLARWSRLKRAEQPAQPTPVDAASGAPVAPNAAVPAAGELQLAEPTKLPRIEDLTAGSDFAAFLQKGVPEELKRLALRKAWSLDPAIRDFIEVAENQYDWNAPGGVPGFGEIAPGTDMKTLLAQAIGEMPKAEAEGAGKDEVPSAQNSANGVASVEPAPQPLPAATAGVTTVQPSPAPTPPSAPLISEPSRPTHRPRHGGALPH